MNQKTFIFNSVSKCYVIILHYQVYRITLYLSWTMIKLITTQNNGALVHSNNSVIQLILYDVITLLANYSKNYGSMKGVNRLKVEVNMGRSHMSFWGHVISLNAWLCGPSQLCLLSTTSLSEIATYYQWRHQGGVWGAFAPPVGGSAPTFPQSKGKNGKNQPFSANFWIFAPSDTHFAPSMPPKIFWCRHCLLCYRDPFFPVS